MAFPANGQYLSIVSPRNFLRLSFFNDVRLNFANFTHNGYRLNPLITSSSGGVPGVDVTLYSLLQTRKPSLNVKIAGVSLTSNIEYNDGSLEVWKAYGIGTSKCIRFSELNVVIMHI